MADNKQIKDGLGNLFTIRMKDVSAAGDGTVQRSLILASLYPIDYGVGGVYTHCARTIDLPAGMTSVPIYAFQWSVAAMFAAIWKVKINAWSTASGFTPGFARFSMYAARPFTVQDSGGLAATLTGNNNKLASSMASSAASIVSANGSALTPGTRTLDAASLDTAITTAPTSSNTPFSASPLLLLNKLQGEHPLLLANNEGFVVHATVPFSGSWQFALTTEWAEVPIF